MKEVEKELERMQDWWFHDDLGAVLGLEEGPLEQEWGAHDEAAEVEDELNLMILWDEEGSDD